MVGVGLGWRVAHAVCPNCRACSGCLQQDNKCISLSPLPCPQGVDIFERDFLIVPVHDALHWSLAIVCHPGGWLGLLCFSLLSFCTDWVFCWGMESTLCTGEHSMGCLQRT